LSHYLPLTENKILCGHYTSLCETGQEPIGPRPLSVSVLKSAEGPGGWNEIRDYTRAQKRFFAWQERWGLAHADAVTVASRTLESLVWALGTPAQRVFYVPNGVGNVPGVPYRASSSGPPVILLYTRFFEFPVSRVIQVLRRVRETVPEARLLVVGQGLSGQEGQLLALAREAGLADGVDYAGWVETRALPAYLARAALAIYPLDDTLINRAKCAVKLLDLLAAGVPVVAEAVGQNREIIRHGQTGWLVQPGDVAAFAGAVVRLLHDEPGREQMGRAAARDVRERFSWERLAKTVETAYSYPPASSKA